MHPNDPAAAQAVGNSEVGSTRVANPARERTRTDPSRAGDDSERLPEQILRFEIRRRLGSGGFGSVYLAYDPTLDREIALKVPREPARWAEDQSQRFLDEARIAARLKHPHVIAIHDAGRTDDGGVYIAMEFVDGESLSERLKRDKLTIPETVRILGEVADAMHHGHKLGLVHRDLKPSNIMLDQQGNVKVCDFGLALHEDAQPFHRGEVSGTRAYMSPEQLEGDCHLLDGRSDVWSLGVMLYECLSGRRPFRGDNWEEIREDVRTRDPKPLRQLDDSIPQVLDDLCRRCFRRNVADRLPTALDFKQTLAKFERTKAPVKLRVVAAVLGSVLMIASLVAAIVGYRSREPSPAPPEGPDRLQPFMPTPPPDRVTTDLLSRAPRQVVFEDADPQSLFVYSENSRRLTVGSLFWSAFACGSHPREMRLTVTTIHGAEPGTAGLFWGLHPETPAGGQPQQACLGVVVEPAADPAAAAAVRLYRLVIATNLLGNPAFESTHELAKAPLVVDWKAPVDINLRAVAGQTAALTVQGHSLDLHPLADVEWEAYAEGECGLLAPQSAHHVVFTQAVLQPLTKE